MPMTSWAQPKITSVTGLQQGGTDVVRVELSEPLTAVPAGFAVQAPPRVAIDLPGVTNASGKSSVEVNQGNIRSVSLASSGERTRLVLNLKAPSAYHAEIQGKALLIALDMAPPVATAAAAQPAAAGDNTHFAASQNADVQELRDIDFRRGADGAGRIVVNLPSNQVGVDLKQQGKDLVVDFLRSNVPTRLRRRLDVTDFGTPVQSVTTTQAGDHVHMVVTPTGSWEHSAYQTDNQFVLEVRPAKVDPNKLVPGTGYTGQRLSLNFQSIEIRALLQIIADFSDFNVVTSDSVTGTVTLRLKDVPWDQALDIILQSKGLDKRRSGNVLLIAPKDELAAKEQVDLEAKRKIADLEPMHTQAFQLNYTKSDRRGERRCWAPARRSGGANSRLLSTRGTVLVRAAYQPAVRLRHPVQARRSAGDDRPHRHRVAPGDDRGAHRRGQRQLRPRAGRQAGHDREPVPRRRQPVRRHRRQLQRRRHRDRPDDRHHVPVDRRAVRELPRAGRHRQQHHARRRTFALSLFSASASRFLNLELSALEEDGSGRIISSPRVITADQVQAVVEAGEELPYQQATSSGATSVAFQKAQIRLQVTPQITPEGNVILDVDVNKDSVGRSTSAGFAIDTKHVKTTALVENGGTVVLGGLFQQIENNVTDKVPFLGDIPFLGNLFKNTSKLQTRTELLIFITPRIISDRTVGALRA